MAIVIKVVFDEANPLTMFVCSECHEKITLGNASKVDAEKEGKRQPAELHPGQAVAVDVISGEFSTKPGGWASR
ncbi:MAG: hypothetical protein ACYC7A_21850 [Thermoanaerobaculia bacterium]